MGAIIPAAVGVDIGCGMMAVRLSSGWAISRRPARSSCGDLPAVPLSAGNYNDSVRASAASPDRGAGRARRREAGRRDCAELAVASWHALGSGNHFIEVSIDEDEAVWLFLHSGSRGVGNRLASKWIKVAQQQCQHRWITLPDPDLAYLVEGDREFWGYLEALRWAQRFAYLNREEMMQRVVDAFSGWISSPVEPMHQVNTHHNYTVRERHFGKEVWLSRKGAIDAHEGRHGADSRLHGRPVVRRQGQGPQGLAVLLAARQPVAITPARRRGSCSIAMILTPVWRSVTWGESDAFLDEHPQAYKPIETVMDDAKDLVEIVHTLRQIINVKGD